VNGNVGLATYLAAGIIIHNYVITSFLGVIVGAAVGVSCTVGVRLGRRFGFSAIPGPTDPVARQKWIRTVDRAVWIFIGIGWAGALACAVVIARAA
jgi:hypothetical protein